MKANGGHIVVVEGKGERETEIMRGIVSIIIGLVFIVGGLSGKMVMRGTESGYGLAVIGVGLIGLGIFRMTRKA
jgi:hypothetical protein